MPDNFLEDVKSPELRSALGRLIRANQETVDQKIGSAMRNVVYIMLGFLIVTVCLVVGAVNYTQAKNQPESVAFADSAGYVTVTSGYAPVDNEDPHTGDSVATDYGLSGSTTDGTDENVQQEFDAWVNLRQCAPRWMRVQLFSGNLSELYEFLNAYGDDDPESVNRYKAFYYTTKDGETYSTYEIWQILYIWGDVPDTTTDPYGSPLWHLQPYKHIDTLDDVPMDSEVYVYNQNGYIGEGNTSKVLDLKEPMLCREDSLLGETLAWAPINQLSLHSTVVLTSTYRGRVGDLEVTSFYIGREISPVELRHLYIENGSQAEPNYIGGSFLRGKYSVNGNQQIMWESIGDVPRGVSITEPFTVTRPLPLMREIIVQTYRYYSRGEYRQPEVRTLRFVLWNDPVQIGDHVLYELRTILISADMEDIDLGLQLQAQRLFRHVYLDPFEPFIGIKYMASLSN